MTDQTPARYRQQLVLGLAVVVICVLVSGVAHGVLDGRWTVQSDLIAFGEGLSDLPERCGDWVLNETRELSNNAQRLLRCHGSLVREYVNEQTGDRVTVAVLFGPRGPIAVHTPEVCYTSVGTEVAGPRESETVDADGIAHSFWKTAFIEWGDPKPAFEVWYGWSDGGPWLASERPRFWMTDNLFKLQLAGPYAENDTESPCQEFLAAFLPEVQDYLATL